jgi:hypothetical protein
MITFAITAIAAGVAVLSARHGAESRPGFPGAPRTYLR